MLDLEYERYKDFDFSGAKRITNPKILEARAKNKAQDACTALFDEDVAKWLAEQNPEIKRHVNAMVRSVMQIALR